jgi:protein SCO1/2
MSRAAAPAVAVALVLAAGGVACGELTGGAGTAAIPARAPRPFPSAVFTSHRGESVRVDEVARERVVVLAFSYLRCTGSCPKTVSNLREVERLLGDRAGRDVAILTVSLDPEHDTPDALARHARELGTGPGLTFLTGAPADVDALRRHLGLYDRYDPGAPRTSHAALLVVGDARAGRWLALPGLGRPEDVADAALRLVRRDGPVASAASPAR